MSSSAYSKSPPTGRPLAKRDTTTPSGVKSRGDVHRGGFALEVGVRADNDLLNGTGIDTGQQLTDLELFGSDAFERIECPAQHVVATVKLPRPLHRHDVAGIFDHAENGVRALGVTAYCAHIPALGHVEADAAERRPLFHRDDGVGQSTSVLGRYPQDMERDPLR